MKLILLKGIEHNCQIISRLINRSFYSIFKKITSLNFTILTLFVLLNGFPEILPSQNLRSMSNYAFTHGERLKFRVHYGWIDAGEILLEVKPDPKKFINHFCYQIVGTGRTVGAFDFFFKIRDHFETHIDKNAIVPWYFIRNVNEGKYSKSEYLSFNHYNNTVTREKEKFQVTENIQDILSALYFARCLDYSTARPGDTFPLEVFLGDKTISMNYKFLGKEVIKTKFGNIRCLKFGPKLVKGRVFKEEEDMTIWVSDDKNHIPIRVDAKIKVGSLKLDIEEYSGLLTPLITS